MKKIHKFLALGIIALFASCSSHKQDLHTQRVWSNLPAYTQVFENQNEYGWTSDVYDGIWEGQSAPQLPRIQQPSAKV